MFSDETCVKKLVRGGFLSSHRKYDTICLMAAVKPKPPKLGIGNLYNLKNLSRLVAVSIVRAISSF